MISFDNVLWHSRCATEVERPKLDRVSTTVKKRDNPNLSQAENNPLHAKAPKNW